MKLIELLSGIRYTGTVPDCEILDITCDSRNVRPGTLFVAVPGGRVDGHSFLEKAVAAGAVAAIVERDCKLGCQLVVENARIAYATLSANWFGNPQNALKLIGITGTNGKTSITYLIRDILKHAGHKVGLIGTIQSEIGDMVIPARHTTPDPMQLYSLFFRMKEAGMEFVVMEVSSHALEQHRVAGLDFLVAVFTNLTPDHLDYHGDMENYFLAKKKLFSHCQTAVINLDDAYGQRLSKEIDCPKITVSIGDDSADYTAHSLRFSESGSRYIVVHENEIQRGSVPMPGQYAVENALCAIGAAAVAGVSLADCTGGLLESTGVLGRTELIDAGLPFTVIRDYAHDPDGIEKLLLAMRSFSKGRIVTLFGCPGERDRTKRAPMGKAAAENSDFVILTSDNPRSEDEGQILGDALPGITGTATPYKVISDRYEAIRFAIEQCKAGDLLLLLGKGHEDYQALRWATVCFDERMVVKEIAQKLREQDTI